jgi:hypothetical protein
MPVFENISFESRFARHAVFWLGWILGFTFIKSFGASVEEYLGWFVYYIITLPVFLIHTYLVVYWLIPVFFKGWRTVIFVLVFVALMVLFSLVELVLSHKLLAQWFPTIFRGDGRYLTVGNVLISGLGNLYIILVFLSAKMIRTWYLSREEKRQLHQRGLREITALTNLYTQPELLMFAMDQLEKDAAIENKDVTPAIAALSELLNGMISLKDSNRYRFDDELKLIRLLLDLYGCFMITPPTRLLYNGKEGNLKKLPSMLAFSLIEIFLRNVPGEYPAQFLLESGSSSGLLRIEAEGLMTDHPATVRLEKSLKTGLEELFPCQFQLHAAERSEKAGITIEVNEVSSILHQ